MGAHGQWKKGADVFYKAFKAGEGSQEQLVNRKLSRADKVTSCHRVSAL